MVLKVEAIGIVEGEQSTTVVVKTAMPNADKNNLMSLITEPKIIANLGNHLNIVNLIGACTKTLLTKGKIIKYFQQFFHQNCTLNYF